MKVKRLTAISIAVAFVTVLQTLVIASVFGIGDEVEVFFLANVFVGVLNRLTLSGQISELFVPTYQSLKATHGKKAAFEANSSLLGITLLFGGILSLASVFFSRPLSLGLGPGLEPSKRELLAQMLVWIAPCLVVQLATANLANLAVCEQRFLLPELGRLVGRTLSIVVILSCHASLFGWALVAGLWASSLLALMFSLWGCVDAGYRFNRPSLEAAKSLVGLVKTTPAFIASILAQQFYAVLINAIMTYCPPGTLAIYNYCERIGSRMTSVIIRPAALVFHARFSKCVARDEPVAECIRSAMRTLLQSTCLFVLLVVTSVPDSIRFLFGAEKFSQADTDYAAMILVWLMMTYFIKGPGVIARKTAVSIGLGRSAYFWSALTDVACALIAGVLIFQYQRLGVVISVASCALARGFASYIPLLSRQEMIVLYPRQDFLRWGFAFGVGSVLCYVIRVLNPEWVPDHRSTLFVKFILIAGCSVGGMLITERLLRMSPIRSHEG